MRFKSHPHMSDQLTFTREDLQKLLDGKELRVSALQIRMGEEPKPDVVEQMSIYRNLNRRFESERPVGERIDIQYLGNVELTFDRTTGRLKSAEVL